MIDNNIIVGAISIRHRIDNDFLFLFGRVFENKLKFFVAIEFKYDIIL